MNVFVPIPYHTNYVISRKGVIKRGKYVVPAWTRASDKRRITRLGDGQSTTVYRLLGYTFVFNPCPKFFTHLDHIDGDCTNDDVDNIRWCNESLNAHNRKAARGFYRIPKAYNPRTKTYYTPPKPFRAKFSTTYLGHYASEEEAHKVYTEYRAKEFTRLYMSYLDKANVSAEVRHRPDILRWSQIDGGRPQHSVHDTGVLQPCLGGEEESDVGSVQSTELLCSEVAPIATKKPQENINGPTDSRRYRYPRIAAC